ncbi:unnamed protein product [Durusdinium trenchii]|uniref:RNA helicase n=3 Tax=Durusdinium trenchii TaxID=1381693 RepID=A0ABP0HXT2_9DINO
MAAPGASTKTGSAACAPFLALLLVLLVTGRAWCDLCRGSVGPMESRRLRAGARAEPERPKRGRRQVHASASRTRPSLKQVLRGVVRETGTTPVVQLVWEVEGQRKLSPFCGRLKAEQMKIARLQEGDEVQVRVIPGGEQLTLQLLDAPTQGRGALQRAPHSRRYPELDWPPKEGRKDDWNWMDAEPLPYCLCGIAAQHLRSEVTHVEATKATLRFFWEPTGSRDSDDLQLELSPIAATLPAEELWAYLNLTTRPPCSELLQPGQFLSVQLKDPGASADLQVALSPLQPMRPQPALSSAGSYATLVWRQHLGRARVFDAHQVAFQETPEQVATRMVAKFGQLKSWRLQSSSAFATAAFAVASASMTGARQDLVILGTMPRAERLSLLALLIAQHLDQKLLWPQERVLLLGPFARERLRSLYRSAEGDELARQHLSRVRHRTIAGSCRYVLQKFAHMGDTLTRSISLVVLEGLPSAPGVQRELNDVLRALPERRWGPTLLWHRDPHDFGPTEQPPMVQALLQAPARLRTASALHGAEQRMILVPDSLSVAAQLVAQHLAQRNSVTVFADTKLFILGELKKLVQNLEEDLAAGRLLLFNNEDWNSSSLSDVMIHALAPPSPAAYCDRLASCRKLAITLIDFKMVDGVERLNSAWLDFVSDAHELLRGDDARRLRAMRRLERHGYTKMSESFQEDFQSQEDELVWQAGIAESDTELIFDRGV